jgi:hypothetical protein
MLEGLKVNFKEEGADIDFGSKTEDIESMTQNALINVGTKQGSDKFSPTKGTDFLDSVKSANVIDVTEAQHICNFVARDTLRFVRKYITDANTLEDFTLKATHFTDQDKLVVEASSITTDNETLGVVASI